MGNGSKCVEYLKAEHTETGEVYNVYGVINFRYGAYVSKDKNNAVKNIEKGNKFKSFDIVKHFKGKKYMIICEAKDIDTGEEFVVYRAMYEPYKIWIRPKDMFYSKVDKEKYPNVKQEFRFEKVD